jgi:hypothetical protein
LAAGLWKVKQENRFLYLASKTFLLWTSCNPQSDAVQRCAAQCTWHIFSTFSMTRQKSILDRDRDRVYFTAPPVWHCVPAWVAPTACHQTGGLRVARLPALLHRPAVQVADPVQTPPVLAPLVDPALSAFCIHYLSSAHLHTGQIWPDASWHRQSVGASIRQSNISINKKSHYCVALLLPMARKIGRQVQLLVILCIMLA